MNILDLRLTSQRLNGETCTGVLELVRWMGALQAQEYAQMVWAVGLRVQKSVFADIDQAIKNREVLLTWPMRGTIHLVPSEDASWMTKLMALRRKNSDLARFRELGIDEAMILRCRAVLNERLSGGRSITRPELLLALQEAGINTEQQRGYQLLYKAAQDGLICFGPREGKTQTFVLLDEWVKNPKELSREEALAEIARRYTSSHGPILTEDLARWTGLSITDSRLALKLAGNALRSEHFGGKDYWLSSALQNRDPLPSQTVHLLPGYDEYFIGYQDRSTLLDDQYVERVLPGKNGVFKPIIVVNGRIVGLWKRTLTTKFVEVEIELFQAKPCDDEELQAAAQSYANFMGLELRMKV